MTQNPNEAIRTKAFEAVEKLEKMLLAWQIIPSNPNEYYLILDINCREYEEH